MKFTLIYQLVCVLETLALPIKLLALIFVWLPYMIYGTITYGFTKEDWIYTLSTDRSLKQKIDYLYDLCIDEESETTEYCETEESNL